MSNSRRRTAILFNLRCLTGVHVVNRSEVENFDFFVKTAAFFVNLKS